MKNIVQFGSFPDSAFKNITAPAAQLSQSPAPNQGGVVSASDFSQTAAHASAYNTMSIPGASETPTGPNVPNPAPNQGTALGKVVGGKMATDLLDLLLPSITVWAVSMIGYNVSKGSLQLTAKEKDVLHPAMQNYLDSININFNNPLYNLLFVFGGIYAAKVIDILPEVQKKEVSKVVGKKVIKLKPPEEKTDEEIVKEIANSRKKGLDDAIKYFTENKDLIKEKGFDIASKEISAANNSKARKKPSA
jgi:hypothetical protein